MVELEDMGLITSFEHIKIPLSVKFSQKTNWKLTERPFYSEDCKKDAHEIEQEGKRSNQV